MAGNADLIQNEQQTISGAGGGRRIESVSAEVSRGVEGANRDNRESFLDAIRGENGKAQKTDNVQRSDAAAAKLREGAAILERAKSTGSLLDSQDFINRWKQNGELNGSEHQVIIGNSERPVEKRTNIPLFHGSWSDYFNRISLHNRFFPETPITVKGAHNQDDWSLSEKRNGLGFTRQLDLGILHRLGYASPPGAYVVTEQPYVKPERETTKEDEIRSFLESRGFVESLFCGQQEWYNPEAKVFFQDAYSRNVVMVEDDIGEKFPVVLDVPMRYASPEDADLVQRINKSIRSKLILGKISSERFAKIKPFLTDPTI